MRKLVAINLSLHSRHHLTLLDPELDVRAPHLLVRTQQLLEELQLGQHNLEAQSLRANAMR
jgi:hypothetical protein